MLARWQRHYARPFLAFLLLQSCQLSTPRFLVVVRFHGTVCCRRCRRRRSVKGSLGAVAAAAQVVKRLRRSRAGRNATNTPLAVFATRPRGPHGFRTHRAGVLFHRANRGHQMCWVNSLSSERSARSCTIFLCMLLAVERSVNLRLSF